MAEKRSHRCRQHQLLQEERRFQQAHGQDGGWIELEYHVPGTSTAGCRVPGYIVAPRTIRHELGHAMGLWHTGFSTDLMSSGLIWMPAQANDYPTPRELQAVAIAYRRPGGNVDPDTDPVSVTLS